MECYFDCYKMSDVRKIRFAGLTLVAPTKIYWTLMERARERQRKNLIESRDEIKGKLQKKYLLEFYRDHLLEELHKV